MKHEKIHETNEGCVVRVLAHPNAKRSGVTAVTQDSLEVSLKAPPTKNKANSELIEVLSRVFDVSKSEIKFISGMQSKEKFLSINRPKSFLETKLAALE